MDDAVHNPTAGEVRALAHPLRSMDDLDALITMLAHRRFVGLGEASHGTHEFYAWRAAITGRLIAEHDFRWIGVEGDWPDCWRIDRWVRADAHPELDARAMLASFERWPTWMWANEEVADFLDWLRSLNRTRPPEDRVGFYGLDVYSLWDSLREIIDWLQANAPEDLPSAMSAWRCFVPYKEDPHEYAWSTRLVPVSCETQVVTLLSAVRRRALAAEDDAAFDALQNAEVAAGAEAYYRAMVRGDRESWNLRDRHMADTADRIARHHGAGSKGILWEHNTHIGDARATDMSAAGMINVGELLRDRHSAEGVALVGFACHRGAVVAASAWGETSRVFEVPPAASPSHEALLHEEIGEDAVLLFGPSRAGPWLSCRRGHRAIGVVYDPRREHGNYVPTVMGARYDALLWFEHTRAVRMLHPEARAREPELETEPSGF
jgi:erythromycin esterase